MDAPDPTTYHHIDAHGIDAEARADALDVLTDLLEWHLAEPRWERVDQLLAELAGALAADDPAALREAVVELELAGPIRVTRIGANPTVPAPSKVRDRANHLVFNLGTAEPAADAAPAAAADESRSQRTTGGPDEGRW